MSSNSIIIRWYELMSCVARLYAALAGVKVGFQRVETSGQRMMELVKSWTNSGHRTFSIIFLLFFSFTGITVE